MLAQMVEPKAGLGVSNERNNVRNQRLNKRIREIMQAYQLDRQEALAFASEEIEELFGEETASGSDRTPVRSSVVSDPSEEDERIFSRALELESTRKISYEEAYKKAVAEFSQGRPATQTHVVRRNGFADAEKSLPAISLAEDEQTLKRALEIERCEGVSYAEAYRRAVREVSLSQAKQAGTISGPSDDDQVLAEAMEIQRTEGISYREAYMRVVRKRIQKGQSFR